MALSGAFAVSVGSAIGCAVGNPPRNGGGGRVLRAIFASAPGWPARRLRAGQQIHHHAVVERQRCRAARAPRSRLQRFTKKIRGCAVGGQLRSRFGSFCHGRYCLSRDIQHGLVCGQKTSLLQRIVLEAGLWQHRPPSLQRPAPAVWRPARLHWGARLPASMLAAPVSLRSGVWLAIGGERRRQRLTQHDQCRFHVGQPALRQRSLGERGFQKQPGVLKRRFDFLAGELGVERRTLRQYLRDRLLQLRRQPLQRGSGAEIGKQRGETRLLRHSGLRGGGDRLRFERRQLDLGRRDRIGEIDRHVRRQRRHCRRTCRPPALLPCSAVSRWPAGHCQSSVFDTANCSTCPACNGTCDCTSIVLCPMAIRA